MKEVQELLNKSLTGTNPIVIDSSDGNVTGDIYSLYAVTDLSLTSISGAFKGSSKLVTSGLVAGQIVYLPISSLEISSGTAILYRNKNI